MTLRHYYSGNTTPGVSGFDQEITNVKVVLGSGPGEQGFSASAALGEADFCKVVVDDPTGSLSFSGLKFWHIHEDTATAGNRRLWTGYVYRQRILRGEEPDGNWTQTGRIWELELVEYSFVTTMRICRGQGANRPAETSVARVNWLLGTNFLADIQDRGLVSVTSVAMDAVDYTGQTGGDVLRDVALATGDNFWAYVDESSNRGALAFFDPDSTLYSSTLRVTNVKADVDDTTTFAAVVPSPILSRDPSRVAAGVFLPYDGGSHYDSRTSTTSNFAYRDHAAPTSNVKTAAKASALATRLLNDHATQEEKIAVRIVVPRERVNDVKHGHRIQGKFSHLPGYTDWTWFRVVSKAFGRSDVVSVDQYVVDLELSPQTVVAALSCANGACAEIDPHVVQLVPFRVIASGTPGSGLVNGAYEVLSEADPGGPVLGLARVTITLPTPPDPRNLIVLLMDAPSPGSGSSMGVVTGMSSLGHVSFVGNGGAGGRIGGHYGCADGASITVRQIDHNFNFGAMLIQVVELAGVGSLQSATLQSSEVQTTTPGVSVTPTAGSKVAIVTKMLWMSWTHDGSAGGVVGTPKPGVTELSETDFAGASPRVYGNPGQWVGYVLASSANGSYDVNPTLSLGFGQASWASMTCIFECAA